MITFRDLWHGHPINHGVGTPCLAPRDLTNMEGNFIARGSPVFKNQSAIRLGVALKNAGVQPDEITGVATCSAHPRSEMHYINASALAQGLQRAQIHGLGRFEKNAEKDAEAFFKDLVGRTGIVFFQDYWYRKSDKTGTPTGDHIDIWNGYRTTQMWLMEWLSARGAMPDYAKSREIWFWPVE